MNIRGKSQLAPTIHPFFVMNKNNTTQLELDFLVIQRGTRVRVSGYDCHNWLNLTNSIGVVDYYSQATGDYLIYFKDKPGIAEGTHLTLYYRREQLEIIQGSRGKCSWEYLVNKKK